MLTDKLWVYNRYKETDIDKIVKEAGISALLAKIFVSRGISDIQYIKDFLTPSLDNLFDPFLLQDMDKAADRVIQAVKNNDKVVIYGDYDVDGTTSVSILYDFLTKQNVDVQFYIPDRLDEGYGLSISTMDKVMVYQPSLLITVDCGITAFEEIKYINGFGIDVIVTDHHECQNELPDAYAIINPCRQDCSYPFKELAGVGVVYKLITAVCKKMGLTDLQNNYLDLVALGTVADVVPLVEENRILVSNGLKTIENTRNLGLKTLIDNSGIKDKKINSWTIGFLLGPRINAAGRTGDAGRVVKLFITKDEQEAENIVNELNEANRFRQETEADILEQVINIVETEIDLEKEKIIVVSGEKWHHGIIGIVASKVTEKYYRPCILISTEEGIGRGSGRSIEGFNLFKALSHCSDILDKFGGHELAAGLSIKEENISAFRSSINAYADNIMNEEDLIKKVKIDLKINRQDISVENIREIELMAPFGAGNPGPVFAYEGIKIREIRTVGESRHLKLKLEDEGCYVEAIGFNLGNMADSLKQGDSLDIACLLEINSWNSNEKVQLNIKDIVKDKNMILRNQYYYSLEKCIGLEDLAEASNDYPVGSSNDFGNQKLIELLNSEGRTAVVVNSFESLKRLMSFEGNPDKVVKKPIKICYTCFNNKEADTVNIIVNPIPESVDFEGFDKIVFFGSWQFPGYLRRLYQKIKSGGVIFNDDKVLHCSLLEEVVPERRDLVAVYQYLKTNFGNEFRIDDLFSLADKIADSYKISMNYFKLKKGLDILEEVDILHKEPAGRYGMLVTLEDKKKEKADLGDSVLFRRMQALKYNSGKLEA
ncbi:MAG: single-stranded-DNA-specific exonuclease RecJ [Bacillota bacterium]|nr:single-stranded-DNA-specific exonuclease RecJ [Bacillota bacterium]